MSAYTRPPTPAPVHDLTDTEFAELDDLLADTPEPLEPLDAVMLDGFLCGVLVQPLLIAGGTWLPHVFDLEGQPLPDEADPVWLQRITALVMRRHAALNRALEEDGGFEPLVLEADDADAEDDEVVDDADDPTDAAADGHSDDTDDDPGVDGEDADIDPTVAALSPVSQALMPWVAGFQHASLCFPDLEEIDDDAVAAALARLYRHLPAETDEQREVVAVLDAELPLATLDDGIEELVASVADLYDLTRDQRYRVETVKRDTPKVGRNDPCPCGSGKKFKVCHGAA